jgi:hypothetical protein
MPPPPLSTSLPRWRQPTAPKIFANTALGFAVWFGELTLFVVVVHAKDRSDNFASVASNIVLLATLAATVGGWIGFVYSRHSRSDRGFILLTAWGMSVSLGILALLAIQPPA